jgi:hypothetical protein
MLELIGFFVGLIGRLINFLLEFIIAEGPGGVGGVNMLGIIVGSTLLSVTIRQLIIGTRDRSEGPQTVITKTFNYNTPRPGSKGGKK